MIDVNVEQARTNMIEQQIRPWEVLDDRVLELFATVPREDFVPAAHRNLAFADCNIPLPHGEVMMSPKVEGRLLQAVDVGDDDRVLEVGTGSGFLTACLAALGKIVYSVDIHPDLVEAARERLAEHRIENAVVEQGDAAQGWFKHAPYDVIAVTGSLPEFHRGFHKQLAVGGRLFMIVGESPVMEALLITRVREDEWATESLFETDLPALENAPQHKAFVF